MRTSGVRPPIPQTIIIGVCRSEVRYVSVGYNQGGHRTVVFSEGSRGGSISLPSQLLEATCSIQLMVPSSVLKAGCVASLWPHSYSHTFLSDDGQERFSVFQDSHDYMGPTRITLDRLPQTLFTSAKSLLTHKAKHSQVLGIRTRAFGCREFASRISGALPCDSLGFLRHQRGVLHLFTL